MIGVKATIVIIISFISTLIILIAYYFYFTEMEQTLFKSGMVLVLFIGNVFQWYATIQVIKEKPKKQETQK